MDVLCPFISVLRHSDRLFHGQSYPRLDVVHPGRAWPSSPSCTWHCSLHYLFLQATPLFPHGVTIVCYLLALTMSNSFLFIPALLRTHSFVFFAIHEPVQSFSVLSSQRRHDVFPHSFWESSFHSRMLLQATLELSFVVSSLKSVCCDLFSAVMARSPAVCLIWHGIPSYTYHLL